MPVLAWIFTLSNARPDTFASGRPQMIPPLAEPVAVRFRIVMFCHYGVVAVTAIAVSLVGSLGRSG